jgi:hypothetical protein
MILQVCLSLYASRVETIESGVVVPLNPIGDGCKYLGEVLLTCFVQLLLVFNASGMESGQIREDVHKAISMILIEGIDEKSRTEEIVSILEKHFLSLDLSTRLDVHRLITMNSYLIDVAALEKISKQCLEQVNPATGCFTQILDLNRLRSLSRNDRLEIFRETIIMGRISLWRGSTIGRSTAIAAAVGSGMMELEGVIIESWEKLDERDRRRLPLDGLRAALELRSGATDGEDINLFVAKRLWEIPVEEFARHMEDETGFRWAVFDLLRVTRLKCITLRECTAIDHLVEIGKRQRLFVESLGKEIAVGKVTEKPVYLCPPDPWWSCLEYQGKDHILSLQ